MPRIKKDRPVFPAISQNSVATIVMYDQPLLQMIHSENSLCKDFSPLLIFALKRDMREETVTPNQQQYSALN